MVLLKKCEEIKNIIEKRYDLSGKEVNSEKRPQ